MEFSMPIMEQVKSGTPIPTNCPGKSALVLHHQYLAHLSVGKAEAFLELGNLTLRPSRLRLYSDQMLVFTDARRRLRAACNYWYCSLFTPRCLR